MLQMYLPSSCLTIELELERNCVTTLELPVAKTG